MMRYILLYFFILFSFTLNFTTNAQAELVDRIVAVVNNDLITLSELNQEGHNYFQSIMKNASGNNIELEMAKARQDILNYLIDQLLLKQEAEKYNIEINEEDIDRAIDQILAENKITVDIFRESLQESGSTEKQYRQKLRGKMIQSKLVNLEIGSKMVITDNEIRNYYEKNYTAKPGESGYHIFQIGISWINGRKPKTKDEAILQAEYARKLLLEGKPFKEVAKTFSDLPSAEDGGDIGVFKEDEMSEYMRNTILALSPGEISSIIETPQSFQILKLVTAQFDGTPTRIPLEEVKNEIKDKLYSLEVEKKYQSWFKDLRAKAFIKENL